MEPARCASVSGTGAGRHGGRPSNDASIDMMHRLIFLAPLAYRLRVRDGAAADVVWAITDEAGSRGGGANVQARAEADPPGFDI